MIATIESTHCIHKFIRHDSNTACPRARRNVEKLVSSCHPVTVNTELRMRCIALLLWA